MGERHVTTGLELWQRFEGGVFFRIAAGVAGHTGGLGLLDRRARDPMPPRADASTPDHVVFEIRLSACEAERARLEGPGRRVLTRQYPGNPWRALVVRHPEGNAVELVCYGPSVQPG